MNPSRKLLGALALLDLLAGPGCTRTGPAKPAPRGGPGPVARATPAAGPPAPWEPVSQSFTGCEGG